MIIKNTFKYAKTTEIAYSLGVLDEVVRSMKINGNLLLRENYSAPWGIAIPSGASLSKLLQTRNNTLVVAFHLVEFGHCEIQFEEGDSVLLNAGEIAVCFGKSSHIIGLGRISKAQPVVDLLNGEPNACDPAVTGQSTSTSLICGVFEFFAPELNPLISALPEVVHVRLAKSGELHNLSGVARLLTEEAAHCVSGSSYITERLLELLCAESIRAHFETTTQPVGWLRGLKDPFVGRAITHIHAQPEANWTVKSLAQKVAMSPSRLAARFVESTGISPIAYVAQCRMNMACQKLRSSSINVDQIARSVGYESAAAFNRAFKKHLGCTPVAWRAKTITPSQVET
jgi:AraC-like DNA-binding protein